MDKVFCNVFTGDDIEPFEPDDAPAMIESVNWINSDACYWVDDFGDRLLTLSISTTK